MTTRMFGFGASAGGGAAATKRGTSATARRGASFMSCVLRSREPPGRIVRSSAAARASWPPITLAPDASPYRHPAADAAAVPVLLERGGGVLPARERRGGHARRAPLPRPQDRLEGR